VKAIPFVIAGALLLPAAAPAQSVTDPQIAAIVVTANQVDIDAGALASSSTSSEVKAFAKLMVTDHEGVNRAAVDLVKRLKVTPEESAISRSLKAGGEKNLATLRGLRGAAFDRAYVDHEVAYHGQVLDALDSTLIPGASNPDLKALLVKVRPAFAAHLAHAKHLQASLAGAK
jgi:putative membrane protein